MATILRYENSYKAITGVTRLLVDKLENLGAITGNISIGKHDPAANLSLILYDCIFDSANEIHQYYMTENMSDALPHIKWLNLRYLLVSYQVEKSSSNNSNSDGNGNGPNNSETNEYHDIGKIIANIESFDLTTSDHTWVDEALEITFGFGVPHVKIISSGSFEVASKLLGAINDKFQFSIAIEVSPIIILPDEAVQDVYQVGVGEDQVINGATMEEVYENSVNLDVQAKNVENFPKIPILSKIEILAGTEISLQFTGVNLGTRDDSVEIRFIPIVDDNLNLSEIYVSTLQNIHFVGEDQKVFQIKKSEILFNSTELPNGFYLVGWQVNDFQSTKEFEVNV